MLPGALKIPLMRFIDFDRYKLRIDIIKYLRDELSANPDDEKAKVLKILRKNPVYMIPYGHNYVPPINKIAVYADKDGDKYVLHENKKLFFPNDMNDFAIKINYAALLLEQSSFSPHRYETDSFRVREGDIIADCGASEGIWALSSVEKAKKIYLFECEDKWIAALQKTFAPWKEKLKS
jgi:hypothetical protein